MAEEPRILEVGGCVRDMLVGVPTHDYDFILDVDNFDTMREWLIGWGFDIFVETPSTLTIRARWPKNPQMDWWDPKYAGTTSDWNVPRRDGDYSDGRHPDNVSVGSVWDDLSRRDFTVNAIAMDIRTKEMIDPFNGQKDLSRMVLRTVGSARDRFTEDKLRIIRALRFNITRDFEFCTDLQIAFWSDWIIPLIASLDTNRKREELNRCLAFSTTKTIWALTEWLGSSGMEALFSDALWLKATQEET